MLTGPQQAPTPSANGLTPDQVEQFKQVFDVFVRPLLWPTSHCADRSLCRTRTTPVRNLAETPRPQQSPNTPNQAISPPLNLATS